MLDSANNVCYSTYITNKTYQTTADRFDQRPAARIKGGYDYVIYTS
jgi:hypothetical protein